MDSVTTAGKTRLQPRLLRLDEPLPMVGKAVSKRLFDVIVALALLIFLAPLLIMIAVAIRSTSMGPALFKQRRTGLNGRVFRIYKFRTMSVMEDGEVRAASRDDLRVTPVGAILRKSSLDELPQLFNVLAGHMSLVGPRPHAVAHDELYTAVLPDYPERFRARPGLTGLAQVTGFRGEMTTLESLKGRISADKRYIAHWSLALDVKILLSTVTKIWDDELAY